MALNFNSVQPTQIIAKDGSSERAITFPTGTKTVTVFSTALDGKKQATATFTSTHNITADMVVCNGKTLNSSDQLISEQTQASTTYLFYAKFSNNTLSLEQTVVYSVTGKPPQSVVLQGRDYSETFYSATDLTVLKYGTTAVWGKPFSLTIQAGANSTVAANRTSSPNQHASTGNITSGGIVYYGDTLTITATPASGYKLVSFTINGTEYANGETSAVSQTITVTSAVSIVINTESFSWKTVWTGSETVAVFSFKGEQKGRRTVTLTNETLAGADWSRPTKITGVATAGSGGISGSRNSKDLLSLELIDSKSVYLVGKTELHKGSIDMFIIRNASAAEVVVSATCERLVTSAGLFFANLLLTKVEQYY
jgi:hypothetical protein